MERIREARDNSQKQRAHPGDELARLLSFLTNGPPRSKQWACVLLGLCFCFAFVPQEGQSWGGGYRGYGVTIVTQVTPLCQQKKRKPRLTILAVRLSAAPATKQTPAHLKNPQPKPKLLNQQSQVELNFTTAF